MYRFRTIDNLLGEHEELENQEIYFASPAELNDPMEGYKDIFWNGDEIIWRNFIVNYIKSVDHIFGRTIFAAANKKIVEENEIMVPPYLSTNKTQDQLHLIEEVVASTFANTFIESLPKSLAGRVNPVRRNELLSYLQLIHPYILNAVSETYFNHGHISKKFFHQNLDKFSKNHEELRDLADLANQLELENNENGSTVEKYYSITNLVEKQVKLIARYNQADRASYSNGFLLVSEFPEKYLSKLEQSIYPNWYSASFLSECSNSSIWGHYGDKHKGVCLKFKTVQNDEALEMNLGTEYGYDSVPVERMRLHKFQKIEYTSQHVEIDFFRSIGRVTKGELNAHWYSDGKGNLSICGDDLNKKEKGWIENYWENFYKSLSIKLSEWSYENEYRLVVHGDFIDYSEIGKRKLKYDFKDLESIIFGINTSSADKLSIIQIIEDKCKKNDRNDFIFHQAYYSRDSGKIENFKLNLLKFA